MRKFLAFLLVLAMVLSLAACRTADNNNETASTDTSSADTSSTDTTEDTATETDTSSVDTTETGTAGVDSPAKVLYADFKSKLAAGETDIEAIANQIITNEIIPFMGGAMPVEEGYLGGFDNEVTGFEKGVMFAPMISTIPFVGYIFELADGGDTAAFKAALEDDANLRWNICTQADEMLCEAEGNLVFFVMAPASFDD